MVLNADGKVEQWSPQYDDVLGLAWNRGKDELLITGAAPGDLTRPVGRSPRRESRLVYRTAGNLLVNDVSRTGQVLITERDWRQEIVVVQGDAPPRSVEWLDWASVSALSDDGKQILFFESGAGAGGTLLIGLRDVDRPVPVQLGRGRSLDLTGDGAWALTIPEIESRRAAPSSPDRARGTEVVRGQGTPAASTSRDSSRMGSASRLQGIRRGEAVSRLFIYDMGSQDLRPPPLRCPSPGW